MKKTTEKPKMYLVRKYIKAVDVKQALRKEPKTPVHDLMIEKNWSEKHLPDAIGFENGEEYDEDEETSYTC